MKIKNNVYEDDKVSISVSKIKQKKTVKPYNLVVDYKYPSKDDDKHKEFTSDNSSIITVTEEIQPLSIVKCDDYYKYDNGNRHSDSLFCFFGNIPNLENKCYIQDISTGKGFVVDPSTLTLINIGNTLSDIKRKTTEKNEFITDSVQFLSDTDLEKKILSKFGEDVYNKWKNGDVEISDKEIAEEFDLVTYSLPLDFFGKNKDVLNDELLKKYKSYVISYKQVRKKKLD